MGLIVSLGFTSCNDFFEAPDNTTFNEDSIFTKIEYTQRLLTQTYKSIPNTLNTGWGTRIYGNSPDCISDLAAGYLGQPGHACHKYHLAQLVSSEVTGIEEKGGWENHSVRLVEYDFPWTAIRYLHIILSRIDEVPDATEAQRERIRGECHLRLGWHYYEMWKRIGGSPLVKMRLDDVEDQKVLRSTLKESYDYILELLNLAINNPYLPARTDGVDFGRVNKALAYAIKAKVQLYAASPLFNTATPYVDFGANNPYICFGNYDKSRWKAAADAATEAIEFCERNGYAIVDDPDKRATGENYIIAAAKLPSAGNTEIIQGWQAVLDWDGVRFFSPRGVNFSGWHGTIPTHNLVELYRNTDGSFVDWSNPITAPANDMAAPYKNLEPRFKVSVAHNGSQWVTGAAAYQLQFWNNPGGTAGAESPQASSANYSYVTWKYSHGYENTYRTGTTWWILNCNMRLAELYMMRAEAMNEFSGPSSDVVADLNKVLNRSGMSTPAGMSYQATKEFIEREYAIEFFLEDHRYHNLKRTLRSMDVLNFEAVDVRCVKNSNGTYTYTRTKIQDRYFLKHYYLWPFPQEEINKDYGLIQNPGW